MSQPVRIPSDVDREDRLLGNLTARQLVILIVTAFVLYAGWNLSRPWVPLTVFLAMAIPVGAGAVFLALGTRDGLPLDRLLLAALRQRLQPSLRVAAPEGRPTVPAWITTDTPEPAAELDLPARAVSEAGAIDLGPDGVALVATASTVNFSLRTPAEQEALVAVLARYLHSLTAPVQILVRAQPLDLTEQIATLRHTAPGLPHPALEAAALEHADYLEHLATTADLLRRQVVIVLREPVRSAHATDGLGGPSPWALLRARRSRRRDVVTDAARRAGEQRLARRLGEAIELLAPAGITVTPLDATQARAVLASTTDPGCFIPAHAPMAAFDDVITTTWDGDL
ncbi:PrgI family protein [Kutzneria buriramensis]|uniref:PrgI family protein n=1 Tax=Kutzneria buriramensis TaxID=1045776 RepID=A0A3E0GUT9_9PSEU|nr:PrgI family protein [Kutzneria buriramensis]REH28661.1 PrgI family protein [Kutzneria buriramensis]